MNLLRYYLPDGTLKQVTDAQVTEFLKDETKKDEFAEFIYERLFHRYINVFQYESDVKIKIARTGRKVDEFSLLYKNGFSIMANCCLLIETIEAFYRGWENTSGKSELAFLKFFSRDNLFAEFSGNDMPTEFYKNIRCGILHQGETTNGWAITRESSFTLDKKDKIINATKFLRLLEKSLMSYKLELKKAKWKDPIWENARKKMKAILKNTVK